MSAATLGIIPARGGSKGVVRKNVRLLGGRPLIAYTIEAARASRWLSHVVVSTEDAEIAEVARGLDCEVTLRPTELAADDTPMLPVVRHALESRERATGRRFRYGVVLQPTVPLRTGEDIDASLALLAESGADSVVGVYRVFDHHPARMYRVVDGRLVAYASEPAGQLRHDLPAVYHRNGAIYAFRRDLVDEGETLIGPHARPYVMSRERSINIDDELDLLLADLVVAGRLEPGRGARR